MGCEGLGLVLLLLVCWLGTAQYQCQFGIREVGREVGRELTSVAATPRGRSSILMVLVVVFVSVNWELDRREGEGRG